MIRVSLFPPRCFVMGRRLHHGAIGLLLLVHDWHDRRCWLRDFLKHPETR